MNIEQIDSLDLNNSVVWRILKKFIYGGNGAEIVFTKKDETERILFAVQPPPDPNYKPLNTDTEMEYSNYIRVWDRDKSVWRTIIKSSIKSMRAL